PDGDELPNGGITTRLLRDLRPGDLLAAHRTATRHAQSFFGIVPQGDVGRRVGRRGREDSYYAEWAAAYVEALTRTKHPVPELERVRHVSASQIRNVLNEARRRELLTAAPSGRTGGELTGKARRILGKEAQ